MNTKLNHAPDWLLLAQQCNWSVRKLAKHCGVCTRTLERHFRKTTGYAPKTWLNEQRQKKAREILNSGSTVKETAVRLGYHFANHFSRDYKKYWGVCPNLHGDPIRTAKQCRILV